MAILDLNKLPEERGEEVPDLNKNPAEHGHGHEQDRGPWEDVVAAVQVGSADHFGVHPADNDKQEQIHQGKLIYFYPN
jgi:hypothetical protein